MKSRSVSCDIGEGTLAGALGVIQDRFPDIEIGSYPYYRAGGFGTTLVARGTDETLLEDVAEAIRQMIREFGGEPFELRPEDSEE